MKIVSILCVLAHLLVGTHYDLPNSPHSHVYTHPLLLDIPYHHVLLGDARVGAALALNINIVKENNPTMTGIIEEYEHPTSSPLSTPDIIQLLLKSCDKIAYENIKEEREHTNTKIDHAVTDIMKVVRMMAEQISSQNSKIADLELKLDTTNKYHEELLITLKKGLQDTLRDITNDVKCLTSKFYSCETCAKTFCTFHQLIVHVSDTHGDLTPQLHPNNSEGHCAQIASTTEPLILQVDGNDSDFQFSDSEEECDTKPCQVINSTSSI